MDHNIHVFFKIKNLNLLYLKVKPLIIGENLI